MNLSCPILNTHLVFRVGNHKPQSDVAAKPQPAAPQVPPY